MLSPVRLSVRRTGVSSLSNYHTKTVEVRIMKFSPYCSPIPLVFAGKFHLEILRGSPSGVVKQGRGGETSYFLALNVNVSKTAGDTSKITINA